MSEPQPSAQAITASLPFAEPLVGQPAPKETIASPRIPPKPMIAPSPVFRGFTPTHLTPSSIERVEQVRKSSRLKKEEVYNFNAPVVLHEHIEEKGMAVDGVLLAFGFALCDDDTMWYHPHAQFECQSKEELYCKWRRYTILRCCVTTEINATRESGVPVIDLDPLGSLYHPKCVNDNCKWDIKPQHIMRLERGQLIANEISAGQLSASRTREKGRWYGPCQDVYPRDIEAKPFSNDPTPCPARRRLIPLSNTSSSPNTGNVPLLNPSPVSLDSLPPSPAIPTVITYGRRKRNKAGPSRRKSRPKPAPITIQNPTNLHDITPEPSREEEEGFDADVTDGSVLRDHLIVSKHQYHRLESEIESLQARLDKAVADLDGTKQEADRQKLLAEQSQSDLEQSKDQLITRLRESQSTLESQVEVATMEVERQQGLTQAYNKAAQEAIKGLAIAEEKIRDHEEKEKAASVKKSALEKENAGLRAEVAAGKAKLDEVKIASRRFFEGLST